MLAMRNELVGVWMEVIELRARRLSLRYSVQAFVLWNEGLTVLSLLQLADLIRAWCPND